VRGAAATLLLLHVLLTGGCLVVTTAATVGGVAAAAVVTAGKVTTATVRTGGKVVASAVTAGGDAASLSVESASRLARAGAVVAVDAGTGALVEIPWQEGLRLSLAAQNGRLSGGYRTARIFRSGRVIPAEVGSGRAGAADQILYSGDVVEFRR
jgi:hypothetical protein